MTPSELESRRREILEQRFTTYDFGCMIEGVDGWSTETPETEWTRTIYLENEADPDAASLKGHFTVRFYGETAVVADEYGMLAGDIIGQPTTDLPNSAVELYQALDYVPTRSDGILLEPFLTFKAGTHRSIVCTWLRYLDPDFALPEASPAPQRLAQGSRPSCP